MSEEWRVCDETVELYIKIQDEGHARASKARKHKIQRDLQSVSGKPVITLFVMM